jgi:hypothetical protein
VARRVNGKGPINQGPRLQLTLLPFIPGVAVLVVGAVRSAKPGSRWALGRYANDPF